MLRFVLPDKWDRFNSCPLCSKPNGGRSLSSRRYPSTHLLSEDWLVMRLQASSGPRATISSTESFSLTSDILCHELSVPSPLDPCLCRKSWWYICTMYKESSNYLAITSTILPPSIFTFIFVMLESIARCRSLQGCTSWLSEAVQDSPRFSGVLEDCSPGLSGTPVKNCILLLDMKYTYTSCGGVFCSTDQQL